MRNKFLLAAVVLMAVAVGRVAMRAQGTQPGAQPSTPQPVPKIEGKVTSALQPGACGIPSFTLRTAEGKDYTIHLGTLKDSQDQVYMPKVGDTITVAGTACCQMLGQNMLHATEITLGSSTFRALGGTMPGVGMGMMMGGGMGMGMGHGPMAQGQMGPGPMGQAPKGPGMMGQGPGPGPQAPMGPGPGMMMCPGMSGQPIPGQGAMAPGAMPCCTGVAPGTAAPTCPACGPQQAPASPPATPPAEEHNHE